MKDTETRAVSTQGTVKFELNQTGAFFFELIDGKESCTLLRKMELNCSAGYEERSGGCVTIPAASTSPVQLVAGVTVGVFAVIAFVGVLCFFAKNPHKFRELLVSFLMNEVVIAASICLEIWGTFRFIKGVVCRVRMCTLQICLEMDISSSLW
jgi:hypothetical protein